MAVPAPLLLAEVALAISEDSLLGQAVDSPAPCLAGLAHLAELVKMKVAEHPPAHAVRLLAPLQRLLLV